MNREILFRGKRLDNGEWVFGDLCHNTRGEAKWIMPWDHKESTFVNIDPATVGQYTGLKDRNGVKIFEGDITFHHRHRIKAYWEWHADHACFVGMEISYDEPLISRYYIRLDEPDLEVIGNIHDNPEHLEVE